ncbi:MAG TPA: serine/threonine-protein kinase, partial [Ktedonobacteraceae bacterium]
GMSDIYLAQDTHTDHDVVIKMVHNSNHEYCERFHGEVQTTSTLHHDHILPTFTYGKYASWSYMVSPYIEEGTLHDRLLQGPLSLRETGLILTQLVSALQFAHDHGIIHRDLKPSNILLQNKEHVYLADFGLAQHVDRDDGLTVTEYLIGTPEYMAPELAEEKATVKSDIYALGVILYQLLTGRVPFKGSTPIGTYLKHIRERPLSPTMLNPAIPEEIADVILRALEKNPGHRYNSAHDLAQAYQHALVQSEYRANRHETSSSLLALVPTSTIPIETAHKRKLPSWSLLSLIAAFGFVVIPTILGIACYHFTFPHFHAASKNVAPMQLQKIDIASPYAQPTSVATVVPAPALRTTPVIPKHEVISPYNNRSSSFLQQFHRTQQTDPDEKELQDKNHHDDHHKKYE